MLGDTLLTSTMSLAYPWTVWLVAVVLVFACTCAFCTPRRPLPPGPRGIPILGHALWQRLPREKPWEMFDLWRKQYGGLASMWSLHVTDLLQAMWSVYGSSTGLC